MSSISIYLNFKNQTEEAFGFYKSIFGGEFEGGISRFGDMPAQEGCGPINESDKNLVMHVCLPLWNGVNLMGTDAPEGMGFILTPGNNVYIVLHPDTKEQADELFAKLSEGGVVEMSMQTMFWGDYYGSVEDRFGVHWMLNCQA